MESLFPEPDAADPYGMSYRPMLSKYGDFLEEIAGTGNVIIEARGGREDKVLLNVHNVALERGIEQRTGQFFRTILNPSELQIRKKSENISGMQLADLLCHPIKDWLLDQIGFHGDHGRFHQLLIDSIAPCLSRHQVSGLDESRYLLHPKRSE